MMLCSKLDEAAADRENIMKQMETEATDYRQKLTEQQVSF